MHYVYILFSKKDRKLYTGYTPDLKARLKKHNNGYVKATKHRLPLELIYYEAYKNRADAKGREVYLKGGKGRAELKIQLRRVFKEIMYLNR
ncbi:TPA: excinuclease ABC subunit C [Candidatus Beckwithbacteria bacterium]|nr:MAG: excinuclease ABC C subunit domain-containing protein, putative endonuclease [Candidatus Beckwithbacteria bacterium GW2011_GWC1_49_16]KKU35113.1 MAG: hypothetical protein UX50_C0006G0039 [Candidatus Beckwithbacteria bacterium GW2011_GWA1_46_30]KKU71562.1 MAG: hypothetical protein UX97_C0005G0045 [Candidatus Beckwithbacteria bacterium GW2011_GWA2_47_25]KKW03485.1 MAG: hypothetical protein UY37_C0005G0048 [Candidatus Beckwithbacteria bacterium GW2011_GWC2_49_11]OGD49141.1 MAG: hypothetical